MRVHENLQAAHNAGVPAPYDVAPTSRRGVKPYAVEQEGRTDRLFAARDPTRVGVKEAVEQEGGTRQRLKGSDQRAWNQDWPNGRRIEK